MLSDTRNGNETWKPMLGLEKDYEVSSTGIVRSVDRIKTIRYKNGFEFDRPFKGNLLKYCKTNSGYFTCFIKKKRLSIHRLVALTFLPNPENKRTVNHKNGIRTDNTVDNLEWATHSENNKHAHDSGRQKVYTGEAHHQAKLTKMQVDAIRSKYCYGKYTISMLCEEYGLSRYPMQAILSNKTWKDEHYTPKRKKVG